MSTKNAETHIQLAKALEAQRAVKLAAVNVRQLGAATRGNVSVDEVALDQMVEQLHGLVDEVGRVVSDLNCVDVQQPVAAGGAAC